MWNDDPLAANGFADDDAQPSWPTTPHPQSPIPNLRRASSPLLPQTPMKDDLAGPVAVDRPAQIYGAPEAGLISPRENTGVNGAHYERREPYLNVRIIGLDRNRRDILIRLDAQTNLSNFSGTTYRNVQRSYLEFSQFAEALAHSNPQTLVPALPLAQTSAPSDDEDDRLVRVMLQRWLARVCTDPILLQDEELRSFVESDFGYQPMPRPRRRAGSGFALMRRQVPDEDEELQRARFELTKLEGQFFDAAKALDRVSNARKALSTAHAEMGNKLINVASTETHPPLAAAQRKIGRAWHSLADLDQAHAISECVILSDSLGYQGLNARSAKETLQQRTGVLEEYQAAVKSAISKRRQIERLKASSSIRPEKVDEALEELEEANKYEQILARRAEGISQNLHQALRRHNRQVTEDLTAALIEHARAALVYDRQILRELEALRPDITNADKAAPPKRNEVPRPVYVPPLEDFSVRRPMQTPPPAQAQYQQQQQSQYRQAPSGRTGVPHAPLPPQSPGAGSSRPTTHPQSLPPTPTSASAEPPLGGRFVADGTKSMFARPPTTASPLSPASASTPGIHPMPSPLLGIPPSPAASSGGPMSAASSSSGLPSAPTSGPLPAQGSGTLSAMTAPGPPSVSGLPATGLTDPLAGRAFAADPLSRSSSTAGLPPSPSPGAGGFYGSASATLGPSSGAAHGGAGIDPLGGARAPFMSQSVRVQPTRSRLDAREAASKLANMF